MFKVCIKYTFYIDKCVNNVYYILIGRRADEAERLDKKASEHWI